MGADQLPRLNVLDLQVGPAWRALSSSLLLHQGQHLRCLGMCVSCWLVLQMQIRRLPKPVIAMVAGFAVGGGNILAMVCDLTVSFPGSLHACRAVWVQPPEP